MGHNPPMKPRLQISRAAIDMIKRFEGCRRTAARTPDGGWVIGHGHTRTARAGAEVSQADAEALLIYDLIGVAHAVNEHTFTPLSQNQFDALCSFVFSIGAEAFRGSAVLGRLNEGAHLQAACAMELWRRAEVAGEHPVVDALVRRRAAEKALFLTPAGPWVAAPSAILRPGLDMDVDGLVPRETPVVVEATMAGDRLSLRRAAAGSQHAHPATAAAEAVTARLADIFSGPEHPAAPDVQHSRAPDPAAGGMGVLAALAAIGIALFLGGLYWAFRFAPEAGLSPSGALTVGWLAGVTGVGCVGYAAYRLFERLGQADEPLSR